MAWKGRQKKHIMYRRYQLRPDLETYMRMRAMAAIATEDTGRDVSMHDVVIRSINHVYEGNKGFPPVEADRSREEALIEQWMKQEQEHKEG